MKLHWFNPENDLALASGMQTYTPKKAAQQMHSAGAALPLWYADPGDMVLCSAGAWLEDMADAFGIQVRIYDHSPAEGLVPAPWGWSAYTRRFFVEEGFGDDVLPDAVTLDRLRSLSHRRTSIRLVAYISGMLDGLKIAPAATEARYMEHVKRWLGECPHAYIKHPWSSSGRGVMFTDTVTAEAALRFADDAIRRQGSVMLEQAHQRLIDFARLYECVDGKCIDLGTSVFMTDEHSAYTGNILAPENVRASMVSKLIGEERLKALAGAVQDFIFTEIAPVYQGVLGVDMFIGSDLTLAVAEINLRKTMGYVANRFADRYLAPGSIGTFSVLRSLPNQHLTPPLVSDRRLVSGTISLTPANPHFSFLASATPKD